MSRLVVIPVANGYTVSSREGDPDQTFIAHDLGEVDVILRERAALLAGGNGAQTGRSIQLEAVVRKLVQARGALRNRRRSPGWDVVEALLVEARELLAAAGEEGSP